MNFSSSNLISTASFAQENGVIAFSGLKADVAHLLAPLPIFPRRAVVIGFRRQGNAWPHFFDAPALHILLFQSRVGGK